jgi:hypothetical protein
MHTAQAGESANEGVVSNSSNDLVPVVAGIEVEAAEVEGEGTTGFEGEAADDDAAACFVEEAADDDAAACFEGEAAEVEGEGTTGFGEVAADDEADACFEEEAADDDAVAAFLIRDSTWSLTWARCTSGKTRHLFVFSSWSTPSQSEVQIRGL